MSPWVELYIFAAQELALFTKYHEAFILKNRQNEKYRVCQKEAETIAHIAAGYDLLAPHQFMNHYNATAKYIHYTVCKKYGIAVLTYWHIYQPQDVLLRDNVEIIWD